ncbi:type II toxin-antitoxin system Phd/YefM family antitoxin [Nocardia sp. CC201C]|nr:type II toxin-antitoxin system Phd/YefM family antitoxin [Nocardia sp. CC201C]
MASLPISKVRENLFGLVKQVNDDHDTLTVVTKTGENAILVAEADWNSLMETLYVLQTHGGIQLLKSAADARAGRTTAHPLIDPDDELRPVIGDAVPETQASGSSTVDRLVNELLKRGASPDFVRDLLGGSEATTPDQSGA